MVTFHSIRALYVESMDNEKLRNIENLFKGTLQIRDALLDDLVTELNTLREAGCEEIPRMRAIYDYLHKSKVPLSSLKYVHSWFQDGKHRFLREANAGTELHLRHRPSYIAKRDMVRQVGIKPQIVCGLVKQSSMVKPSWMNAGKPMRAFLSAN